MRSLNGVSSNCSEVDSFFSPFEMTKWRCNSLTQESSSGGSSSVRAVAHSHGDLTHEMQEKGRQNLFYSSPAPSTPPAACGYRNGVN